ncbi:MAG TPA: porin family protein [Longimicrobium sp.]|nr:porin family protein [Longimicrobium sp.]
MIHFAIRRAATVLVGLASLAAAPRAHAQLTVELRGGAAIGAYEATTAGLQTVPGPAFGATLGYSVRPNLELFAGYSRASFGCNQGFCDTVRPTFTAAGAEAGVRVELPARIWVRGALAMQSLGADSDAADETSDAGVGLKVGAGLGFPLGRRISVTPGVEYTRFNTNLDDGDDGVGVLTAGLGLRLRF